MSVEEYIFSEIKNAIFNRKIPLNYKLSEETLAQAFGVSRTPIRAVLKKLQHEKIVQIIPNKGAYIYQPSEKEISDVFQLRLLLEKEAVKIACQTMSAQQYDELENMTIKEEEEFKKGDYEKGIELTSQFHHFLVKLSNNNFMINYNHELLNITNVYLAFHDTVQIECPMSPKEHRGIIEALKNKDIEESVNAVDEHFKHIKKHLKYKTQSSNFTTFSDIFSPYKKLNNE